MLQLCGLILYGDNYPSFLLVLTWTDARCFLPKNKNIKYPVHYTHTKAGNEPYFGRRASSESWDLKRSSNRTFQIFEPPYFKSVLRYFKIWNLDKIPLAGMIAFK